jgi:hypothetical protein
MMAKMDGSIRASHVFGFAQCRRFSAALTIKLGSKLLNAVD